VLTTDLIDHVAADGTLLATAAEHAGWDAPVPNLDWTVRDLVTHVGGVHRWATDIVTTAGQDLGTAAGAAVGTGPDDDELLDWFLAGHAGLVTALSAAPAHETAIHRADAQGADGADSVFDADFAQDGIRELVHGFARRKSNSIRQSATVLLAATDAPVWTLTFGGDRIEAEETSTESATATVRGSSSDLYLWLWNRPSAAHVSGDEGVAQLWHDTVRVRWG
jgi:uncharacterized protein (TIGR03083 family)